MHARCVDQLHHHEHQRQAEHRGQAQRDAAEIILRRGGGGGSGGGHADLRISVPAACASRASTQSPRSEEHTSELQSLMRISYAVFFLKKTKINTTNKECQLIIE